MIELFTWIILFALLGGATVLLRYWTDLLRRQDTYHRTELVDFASILLRQLQLFGGLTGAFAVGAGVAVAWLLVLTGGLLSPDYGPEPDWAGSSLSNYFFQSALTVLLFHVAWPAVRTLLDTAPRFVRSFFEQDDSFFWGLSVSLASHCLTAWGVDHEISFLYVVANDLLLLAYAIYRLNLSARRQEVDTNAGDGMSEGADGTGEGIDGPLDHETEF